MALIDLIKQLRDRTGAGLMDCKAALLNNDEDLDKATDWLREKGLAKAAKKADRIAAEGLALTKTCEKCGKTVILEVNCETDFVAKGDAFKELVDNVAGCILKNAPKDVEAAKELTKDLFTDATVKMGEKFDLRRFEVIEKGEGEMTDAEKEAYAGYDKYRQQFIDAMDDDLNTADGITAVFELVTAINTAVKDGASKEFAEKSLATLMEFADVLGILQQEKADDGIGDDIQALVDERQQARKEKNFARADEIRDQLAAMGITLKDTPQGVQIIKE